MWRSGRCGAGLGESPSIGGGDLLVLVVNNSSAINLFCTPTQGMGPFPNGSSLQEMEVQKNSA